MDKWYDKQIMANLDNELEAKLDLAADLTVGEIRLKTSVKSGNLRRNTAWRRVSRFVRRIYNNTEYARYVEFGTGPHIIKPDKKKALAFDMAVGSDIASGKSLFRNKKTGKLQKSTSKNTKIIVKSIKHPGSAARPFMRPGFRAAIPKIKKLLVK